MPFFVRWPWHCPCPLIALLKFADIVTKLGVHPCLRANRGWLAGGHVYSCAMIHCTSKITILDIFNTKGIEKYLTRDQIRPITEFRELHVFLFTFFALKKKIFTCFLWGANFLVYAFLDARTLSIYRSWLVVIAIIFKSDFEYKTLCLDVVKEAKV